MPHEAAIRLGVFVGLLIVMSALESLALKLLPGIVCVDRRQLQQVIELVTHVGQLSVDLPDGFYDCLASQRMIMRGPVRGL